jgi:hypothetical protein
MQAGLVRGSDPMNKRQDDAEVYIKLQCFSLIKFTCFSFYTRMKSSTFKLQPIAYITKTLPEV